MKLHNFYGKQSGANIGTAKNQNESRTGEGFYSKRNRIQSGNHR